MFVTDNAIAKMVDQYGQPVRKTFDIPVSTNEIEFIRSTQKNGRNHDVTLYIVKDDKIIVVAKHFYPPGLFRAPSGGIAPGEDFETGAKREAGEETGCKIVMERFLLQTDVNFIDGENLLYWRSFIFQARYLSGDFQFTDKKEIRELRLVGLADFIQFSKTMRSSEIGGLHYRAALHDTVKGMIDLDKPA